MYAGNSSRSTGYCFIRATVQSNRVEKVIPLPFAAPHSLLFRTNYPPNCHLCPNMNFDDFSVNWSRTTNASAGSRRPNSDAPGPWDGRSCSGSSRCLYELVGLNRSALRGVVQGLPRQPLHPCLIGSGVLRCHRRSPFIAPTAPAEVTSGERLWFDVWGAELSRRVAGARRWLSWQVEASVRAGMGKLTLVGRCRSL